MSGLAFMRCDECNGFGFFPNGDRCGICNGYGSLPIRAVESASPPRAPGASAHPLKVGVESGPGQPIDICERMNRARDCVPGAELRMLLAEGEMEIRRLREQVECWRERYEEASTTEISLLRNSRAEGLRAGIEAAARWLEAQRGDNIATPVYPVREFAAAIRALADAPPANPREGG